MPFTASLDHRDQNFDRESDARFFDSLQMGRIHRQKMNTLFIYSMVEPTLIFALVAGLTMFTL